MVKYYLVENTDKRVVYEYYPEDRKEKVPGLIVLDKIAVTIGITKLTEDEHEAIYTEEELRDFHKALSEMTEIESFEEGLGKLVGKPRRFYADHALNNIIEDYKNGIIREKGMSAWY